MRWRWEMSVQKYQNGTFKDVFWGFPKLENLTPVKLWLCYISMFSFLSMFFVFLTECIAIQNRVFFNIGDFFSWFLDGKFFFCKLGMNSSCEHWTQTLMLHFMKSWLVNDMIHISCLMKQSLPGLYKVLFTFTQVLGSLFKGRQLLVLLDPMAATRNSRPYLGVPFSIIISELSPTNKAGYFVGEGGSQRNTLKSPWN